MNSQKKRLLRYLESGKSITRLTAWSQLGIIECPARISELRAEGYDIYTELVTVTNSYDEKVRIAKWTM